MQRNLEEENKQSSIGTEMFGRVLCKVLSGNMFKTEFYFEGVEPVNTSKQIKTAVDNLRLFIQQGSWTNNDFQRFVIMNLELSSTEIARVYQKKQYKEASVRTTKRRALEKLSSIIDVQYLNCFLLNSDLDPKEQYKLQRVACRYLKYLNSKHLNNSLFPKEVTEALLRYHQSSEIFDI